MENIPIPENVKLYITALQDYYERKTEYEESYKSKKKDILKQKELSYKKMSSKIQKIDRYCVQCGRKGGTIFKQENRFLIARCGCEEPCELNINLKLSLTIDLYKEIDKLETYINTLKDNIVITKLSYLFDLEREDITTQKFEAMKQEFKEQQKKLEVCKKVLINQLDYFIFSEEDGSNSRIHRKLFIKSNTETLNKHISDMQKILLKNKKDPQKYKLSEAVRIYVNNITPLLDNIRNVKYNISYVEPENNKFKIQQHKNYISNYYLIHNEGEILQHDVANVKKKKKKRRKRQPQKEPEPEKEPEKEPADEDESPHESGKEIEKDDGPRLPEEKGETPDGETDKEDSSSKGEKPLLKKKSDDPKNIKIDDLNDLEEFDPEIDS